MPLGKRINSSGINQPLQSNEKISEKINTSANDKETSFTLFQAEKPQYSFEDIILNRDTYDAIQDVLVLYEKRELLFDKWGLGNTQKKQNRAGINLYGYPGTGKSMVAHAIANQLGRNILAVDYSQIESKYVGETSKNLVSMFDYAKESNSIIFFDEADALLSRRVTNMSNSTDVSVNQTRSVLLVLINDFDDLILFASNFISNYDPAFIRRILAHVKFDLPDEENRLKLWRMHIPQQMPTDVDIKTLAEKYNGVSGADISNAVFNASLRAARLSEDKVCHIYFEEAIERIIQSKADNDNLGTLTSKRVVSEEYVKSQFGGRLPK
ncbi:MAG: ATP-binding protein [Lachnospiraceae bacterium]|nr:ATP-binding protein [Lachnospiraceae bacterium]